MRFTLSSLCSAKCLLKFKFFVKAILIAGSLVTLISGVAQWLACWAHNSKVGGSKPLSAKFTVFFCSCTLQGIWLPALPRCLNVCFVGLVVMTLASHARGPRFNPGTKYDYLKFSFLSCIGNRSDVWFRKQHWSSGYDVRLTRGRSPVQSWDAVSLSFFSVIAGANGFLESVV